MIAKFERDQIEGQHKLTTEERLDAQMDMLNTIAEEFVVQLLGNIRPTNEMIDLTETDRFDYELQKITDLCKTTLIGCLTTGFMYDHTKSYESNMEDFSTSVLKQIKSCLLESSRYVASRTQAPSDTSVSTAVLQAAKKWFLTPEECKELEEQRYWRYY